MHSLEKIERLKIIDGEDISNNDLLKIKSYGRVSIDIETTGLSWRNDQLATVQIFSNNLAFIYKEKGSYPKNIVNMLTDSEIEKIFHHAMFDMRFIIKKWDLKIKNIVCTKIASKILNKNRDEHSLKSLLLQYLDVNIEKDMWNSNWLNASLTDNQIRYALNDVLYLQPLFDNIYNELKTHSLIDVANASYEFAPYYAWLQVNGYTGVFKH